MTKKLEGDNLATNTIQNFLQIIKSKLGCGYVLGSQGEIMTPERLEALIKWAGGDKSKYISSTKDARLWYGYQCFDCSGLVIWTLQQMNILKTNEDYIAHNIYYNLCTPLKREELKAGDLCFVYDSANKNITHVGVYIGNQRVIHARGTKYGVVETGMLPYFSMFGRLNCFKDELNSTPLESALEYLTTQKIIDSPDYWLSQINNIKSVPYLEDFILKIVNAIKDKKEMTLEDSIKILADKDIINSHDYWVTQIQNIKNIKYLDQLIIKLVKGVK